MIEELRPEDYNTMMLEEKIQNLEIEKKKKVEEIKTYKSLLATKKQNALNPLDQIMMKRKRDAYLKSDAGAIKEEIKEQVLDADRKKIHVMLSTEQKKRVLEIEEAFGPAQTEAMTGVSEKNILRWKASGVDNLVRKKGSGRRVTHPEFEDKLLDYFKDLRKNGIGLSTRKFVLYARTEAKKDSNIKIKFSRGWLTKFMIRNKITLRKKSTTTRTPNDELQKITTTFRKKIHDLIYCIESKYDKEHVINVDETGIRRDAPPEKTMENKGEKKVVVASGGKEKECLTTVISISLTGKRLGQMIILKGKGVKKPKCVVPHDVTLTYNEKSSWMNSSIMLEWVNFILEPHAKKLPANKSGLLLMDNHRTHIDEKVIKKIKSFRYDVIYLPPNTTGRTQPVDLGINRLLKSNYQMTWEDWFQDNVKKFPRTAHYIAPSKELMIGWIWKSLRKLSTEQISSSWNVYKNLDMSLEENGNKHSF